MKNEKVKSPLCGLKLADDAASNEGSAEENLKKEG